MALESQVRGRRTTFYCQRNTDPANIHLAHCFRSLDALTADPADTLNSPVTIINLQMNRISLGCAWKGVHTVHIAVITDSLTSIRLAHKNTWRACQTKRRFGVCRKRRDVSQQIQCSYIQLHDVITNSDLV